MNPKQTFDVLIAGYGPTGATLANLLGRRGFTVAVADQAVDIYDKPRASSADHESMRIFQECGLADEIEPDTSPHPGTDYFGLDGQIIKRFYPQPAPFPLAWEPTFMFIQPKLEAVLRRGAERHAGFQAWLGYRLETFAQDAEGVSAMLRGLQGDDVVHVRAKYLMACDGGRSFVRRSLSIELEDLGFDEWWIVVDAWLEGTAELPQRSAQFCNPARPATYIVGHGNMRRWEIKLLPGESPDDFRTEEQVRRVLSEMTNTAPLKLWRTAVYQFHAVVAQRWRQDRVFLLGDAAHQTPPFLAQGMCAGIRDASNLAWKLDAIEHRGAPRHLLDTYEQERKPHVRTIVAHAKTFGLIIGELDTQAARARDQRLQTELACGKAETVRQKFIPGLNAGLIDLDESHLPQAGAGKLFVQPWVQLQPSASFQRLDDLTKGDFLLVSNTAEPLAWVDDTAPVWKRLGVQRVLIQRNWPVYGKPPACMALRERDGIFDAWLNNLGAKLALVRPDHYVYGTANGAQELSRLLRQLEQALFVLPHSIA